MGHDQERPAFGPGQVAEQGEHASAALGVEVAGRLVGEDHRRRAGQRPRHGDPLPLASREVAGPEVLAIAQADRLEHPVGLATGLRPAPSLEVQGVLDILGRPSATGTG